MNNSRIAIESLAKEDHNPKEKLQQLEAQLVRIIEAVQGIRQTREWSTLKTEVFDGLTATLEKELRNEAIKDDPDPKRLRFITGELKWARRFSNLEKYEETKRVELKGVRQNLYGKPEL